jgi:quinol monooxygenase YgiN
MKTRIFILFSAAVMMAACCGRNSQSSSCQKKQECSAHSEKPACCKEAAKTDEKACCHAAEVKKVISAQVLVKPEKVDAFIAATQDLIEKSRAEAGCISYSLYQDPQDKTKFLFFEEWKNQTAVDVHFATEHFQKFGEVLNDCALTPAVITIFDAVAEEKL